MTGGHLGAGLGVVELTVALHYLFDTPRDRLDLGRQPSSLSAQNFDRAEEPNSHAPSAGGPVGLHAARRKRIRPVRSGPLLDLDLRRPRHGRGARSHRGDNRVVCVIGDGAMSAGMAYEAMNNAGALSARA